MIVRDADVFQVLNIVAIDPDARQGTQPQNRSAGGTERERPLIQVPERRQLGSPIADIRDIEYEIARQFLLNTEIPLLNIRRALVWILRLAGESRLEHLGGIEQAGGNAILQAEKLGARLQCVTAGIGSVRLNVAGVIEGGQ